MIIRYSLGLQEYSCHTLRPCTKCDKINHLPIQNKTTSLKGKIRCCPCLFLVETVEVYGKALILFYILKYELLFGWRFSRYSAPIHWVVYDHMTSNNETVSRQMPWVGNIAKTMTSNRKQFTVAREMLTAAAHGQSMQLKVAWCCGRNLSACAKICFCCFFFFN